MCSICSRQCAHDMVFFFFFFFFFAWIKNQWIFLQAFTGWGVRGMEIRLLCNILPFAYEFPSSVHAAQKMASGMRLTYIYFFIAVTQGSHDFRFDMGRMGIRAGKLTSPEFFDKEVLVLLVRNMCESFDKNGKTKCAHKCFTQSKGFIL